MTPVQNLFYAIGELAYAMACADGRIQKEERKLFQSIVEAELRMHDYNIDISDIIFRILDKDHAPLGDAYENALREIRLNSQYLSPQLKTLFMRIMDKVARSNRDITPGEQKLLERFKNDISSIHGDPDIYSK